jgi:hypothetical protein
MADFAPNYTARYRIRYSSLGKSHSMLWRVASGVTDPAGIASKVGLFLEDCEPFLYDDWTLTSADFAEADTDIFLPAVLPDAPTGAVAVAGAVANDAALAVGWVGRTTLGGKARMFLYGTNIAAALRMSALLDFRILSSENADVSATVVRLNETSPAIVGNDDAVATWYEYVNVKYNDRWVRRLRRG